MEFKPAELIGAMIVDSEGYIYGNVTKIEIEPKGPIFKIRSVKNVRELMPDINILKQDLIKYLKEKNNLNNMQELNRFVARELKVESITENDLVNFAKLKGLTIPIKEVSMDVEEEKPGISMDNIKAVFKSEFGTCILTKTPIEAKIRGIEPKEALVFQEEESLKGKDVIDTHAKILGKVHSFVMSVEGLGIKVSKKGMVTKLISDIDELKKTLFRDRSSREIKRDMASFGFEQPQNFTDEKLIAYAKIKGYEIPKRVISNKTTLLYKDSVFWDDIKNIGDVVLLNGTLTETFEEETGKEIEPVNVNVNVNVIPEPQKPKPTRSSPSTSMMRDFSFSTFLAGQERVLMGVYVGTLLIVLIGLVPYIGALLAGAVAGYIARGWRNGAVAGTVSCLAGTLILVLIIRLLMPGLGDFLGMILPDFILEWMLGILNYATQDVFIYTQGLANTIIGFLTGSLFGYIKET